MKTIFFNTLFSGEQFSGTLFLPALLLLALPTSIIAGSISDRRGRKPLVYLSGFMMTVVCLMFIIFQNQYGALIAGAFFGIGYGAYTSVDWALTTDASANGRGREVYGYLVGDGYSAAGDRNYDWRRVVTGDAYAAVSYRVHGTFRGDDCVFWVRDAGYSTGEGSEVVRKSWHISRIARMYA